MSNSNQTIPIALSKTMRCPSKLHGNNIYGYPHTHGSPQQLLVAERGEATDTMLNDARATVFEFLHPDHRTKMYFDVDCEAEGKKDCEANKTTILHEAVDLILATFPKLSATDLRVCSYTGQDLSKNNKNSKYGKYLVSYHIVVHGYTIDRTANKAIAKHLKETCTYFDTTVYSGNQMFRCGWSHKFAVREAGCRSPKHVLYDAQTSGWYELEAAHNMSKEQRLQLKYENLITYVTPDTPIMPVPPCVDAPEPVPAPAPAPEPKVQEEPTGKLNEKLLSILKRLPDADLNEYHNWLFTTTLCEALGETAFGVHKQEDNEEDRDDSDRTPRPR